MVGKNGDGVAAHVANGVIEPQLRSANVQWERRPVGTAGTMEGVRSGEPVRSA